ncbi:hypothetical protein PLANTIT3_60385 [Plantibacter sp. T3]|nr:hypothetical protein PLANTIT3_60385 [Plantibacter sp. T3]
MALALHECQNMPTLESALSQCEC